MLDEQDRVGLLDRYRGGRELAEAYAARPRTRVYEYINYNHDAENTWSSLVAQHLGRLSRSRLQVVCSVFESVHGDESLGAHTDLWYGAIVQFSGIKRWQIGEGVLTESAAPREQVITRPGDILLLPKGLPHAVTTPADPGHSIHLSFAIDRDELDKKEDLR